MPAETTALVVENGEDVRTEFIDVQTKHKLEDKKPNWVTVKDYVGGLASFPPRIGEMSQPLHYRDRPTSRETTPGLNFLLGNNKMIRSTPFLGWTRCATVKRLT